ncbi:MAG: hypothetical protein ABSE92_16315 [Terriglobales bacterium]|jgi:hypothetical protein
MASIRKQRWHFGRAFVRTIAVVSVCALALNVATRYSSSNAEVHLVKAVKSNSPEAKRQHLLSNGAHWTAPTSSFTFLAPPRPTARVVSADVLPTNLFSESWLYNRPPPPSVAFSVLS